MGWVPIPSFDDEFDSVDYLSDPSAFDTYTNVMTDADFQPTKVPVCSQALVTRLKQRLAEAIESGKAVDAKAYLDIIERLAKLHWLDDETLEQRAKRERDESLLAQRTFDAMVVSMHAQPD